MKKLWNDKTIAGCAVAALVISLVPLLVLGCYNHPCADDFNYGLYAAQAVGSGESILGVLAAAARKTAETYENWQGTFSAVFLMALHPAVFSEKIYFLTPVLMIGSVLFGTFFFLHTVCVQRFSMPRSHWVILSCVLGFFSIQFAPDAYEGFFWYNGSLFYTFFYGVCLCCYALLLKFFYESRRGKSIAELCGAALLAFFIGGGNYPTALLSCLVFAAAVGFALLKKLPKSKSFGAALCLVLEAAAFLVSVLAPGNSVRQDKFVTHPGAVEAVLAALLSAVQKILEYTTLPVVLGILLLLPIFLHTAKKMKFSFPLPILAPLAMICILGVEMTPPYYAMSHLGAKRIHDLYYYTYWLLLAATVFYLCGWFAHHCNIKLDGKHNHRLSGGYVLGVTALLCLAVVCSPSFKEIHCVSAAGDLLNGTAKEYDRQMDERVAILQDPAVTDAVLSPITTAPEIFREFGYVLNEDPEYLTNQRVAAFYGKSSVRCTEGQ